MKNGKEKKQNDINYQQTHRYFHEVIAFSQSLFQDSFKTEYVE